MTDTEILNRLKQHDEDATRQYFYGWCRMAYALCNKRYNLWEKESMDFFSLAHEFYLQLAFSDWSKPERRSPDTKLSTWMVNGFRFLVLDRLKKALTAPVHHEIENIDVSDANLSQEVRKMLSELAETSFEHDETSRTILQRILIEGYTGKEVARELGLTPSAVSQRYRRMMDELIRPYFITTLEHPSACSTVMLDEAEVGAIHYTPNIVNGRIMKMENKNTPLRVSPDHIRSLEDNQVFVFGSNLAGMHGGGAARAAYEHYGAEWGVGVGLRGHSYAIPTMQGGVETIKPYVDDFIDFARNHPELQFLVTRIGCGIAGFDDADIAPLFEAATQVENIYLPITFWDVLL